MLRKNQRTNIVFEDLTTFDHVLTVARRITNDEQRAKAINGNWFNAEVLGLALPYTGNLRVLNLSRKLGLENFSATTRVPDCEQATIGWFNNYAPWLIAEDRFYIRKPEDDIPNELFKTTVGLKLRADLAVEDYDLNARKLLIVGIPTVLIDRPWNRAHHDLDDIRVRTPIGLMAVVMAVNLGYPFGRNAIVRLRSSS